MTSTPHDAAFKSVFEQPEHAAAELQQILPAHVVAAIRWPTLTLEPGSFVDPELADSHSDLLFSADAEPSGDRVLVYLLFEHQSTHDSKLALRFLGYMVRIWNRCHQEDRDAPLPLIVPALLAQVPGGWTAPTRFSALFSPALGELAKGPLPDFEYSVDDLAHVSDDDLRQRALDNLPKVALWLMRDARDAEALLRSVRDWLPTLEAIVRAPTGREAAARLLRYVLLVSDKLRFEQFRDTLRELAPATEALTMTIAEQLRAEGKAKWTAEGEARGEAKGKAEGKAESLLLVLEARGLQLPESMRARVEGCADVELLDQWIQRAATIERIEDLFEG